MEKRITLQTTDNAYFMVNIEIANRIGVCASLLEKQSERESAMSVCKCDVSFKMLYLAITWIELYEKDEPVSYDGEKPDWYKLFFGVDISTLDDMMMAGFRLDMFDLMQHTWWAIFSLLNGESQKEVIDYLRNTRPASSAEIKRSRNALLDRNFSRSLPCIIQF